MSADKREIKMIRALEIAWILIGLTSAGVGVYESLTKGFATAYLFFIFAILAGLMALLRRRQRIRMK